MTGSTSETIQSVDINSDGKYEDELDCQWKLIGDPGKILSLTFSRFVLEAPGMDPNNEQECYDFVEVNM